MIVPDMEGGPVAFAQSLLRRCIAEFIGDLIFIFIGSLCGTTVAGTTGIGIAHGLTIALLVISLGHISGGHFNPAVTIGVFIGGAISLVEAIAYILFQLLGGFVGAILVRAVLNYDYYVEPSIGGGVTNINSAVTTPGQAIVMEVILTYILVQSVLCSAVDTSDKVLAPLAIGFSVLVDIIACGDKSGASMNLARTFGPAAAYSIFGPASSNHWQYQYVYWVGVPLGGALAGLVYRLVLGNDEKRLLLK